VDRYKNACRERNKRRRGGERKEKMELWQRGLGIAFLLAVLTFIYLLIVEKESFTKETKENFLKNYLRI
jgi:hypothetical protein